MIEGFSEDTNNALLPTSGRTEMSCTACDGVIINFFCVADNDLDCVILSVHCAGVVRVRFHTQRWRENVSANSSYLRD